MYFTSYFVYHIIDMLWIMSVMRHCHLGFSVNLFRLFYGILSDKLVSARCGFVVSFFLETLKTGTSTATFILQFMPTNMVSAAFFSCSPEQFISMNVKRDELWIGVALFLAHVISIKYSYFYQSFWLFDFKANCIFILRLSLYFGTNQVMHFNHVSYDASCKA